MKLRKQFGGVFLTVLILNGAAVASPGDKGEKSGKVAAQVERASIVESLPPRSEDKPNKFKFHKTIENEDSKTKMISKFWDESGKLIFEDETWVKDGQLSKYEVNRYQTGEKASINYDGKKLVFEYQEKDGKKKQSVEKQDDVVLTSGMIGDYIRKNLDDLLKNKRMSFRFASWDRMETVGFGIKYKKKTEIDGKKVYMFEMTPSSFVIALIVSPIKLYLSRDDAKEMVLVDGRMAVKGERDGKLFDLDGKMSFVSEDARAVQSKPSS